MSEYSNYQLVIQLYTLTIVQWYRDLRPTHRYGDAGADKGHRYGCPRPAPLDREVHHQGPQER